MMKKFLIALGILLACQLSAYADPEVPEANAPGVFTRYVAEPTRWTVGAAWGVTKFLFRVGQAPVDKAFELVGMAIGRDPNEPLFE